MILIRNQHGPRPILKGVGVLLRQQEADTALLGSSPTTG